MTQDYRDGGRRALEEEFFARQSLELMAKLKAERTRAENSLELSKVSGIKDEKILAYLLDNKVTPLTAVAMSSVPLVLTAWADGSIAVKERSAILKALTEEGLHTSDPAYQLIESWLGTPPDSKLFETWKVYIQGLRKSMEPAAFANLKQHIMERTQSVAKAAGGYLGLGAKISPAERAQIEQLETAFLA